MITFGICLLYYGIALFLYQAHGWIAYGVWVPFPVARLWEGFFGVAGNGTAFEDLLTWLLAWPASLALLSLGLAILTSVFLGRRAAELHRDSVRRKWILQQCATLGYKPWAIPKVLRELDDRIRAEKAAQREEVS